MANYPEIARSPRREEGDVEPGRAEIPPPHVGGYFRSEFHGWRRGKVMVLRSKTWCRIGCPQHAFASNERTTIGWGQPTLHRKTSRR